MSIDHIDIRLLAALETDGRLSFAELANGAGLSKTACWNRIQQMIDNKTILGFKMLIDPPAIGLDAQALIYATVDFSKSGAFEAAIVDHPNVLSCYSTTGESDYIIHVIAESVSALDNLFRQELSKLPGVLRFSTSIATRTIKANGALCGAKSQQ